MKDALFAEQMLKKGHDALEKVKTEFVKLTLQQLNWKPSAETWSIAQCLDHLVTSDCLYFPALRKIADRNYKMTSWERWNPLSVLFGRMLVNQLQETVKNKVKGPELFAPAAGNIDMGILERFKKHQDTLLEYIAACKTINLDRTHITSPVSKFVTYSLRNAITILIHHQHRHINQAIRVKLLKDFPA